MTDLYTILGVGRNATADEIKKAYRKLAAKHHPDKGGDTDKMTELTRAYSVLSNEKSRDRYDTTGEEQETPFERKFQEFVQMFFLKIIDTFDVERVDLLGQLKQVARDNIKGTKGAMKDADRRMTDMQKVLNRLEAKGENRISAIVQMNIDGIKKEIGTYEDHIKFMGEVLECLGSYHYNFEQQQEEINHSFITYQDYGK